MRRQRMDCHFQAADYDAENCPELIRDQIPGTLFDDGMTPSFLPGRPSPGARGMPRKRPLRSRHGSARRFITMSLPKVQ